MNYLRLGLLEKWLFCTILFVFVLLNISCTNTCTVGPCDGYHKVSAAMVTREVLQANVSKASDTIIASNTVEFSAAQDADTYEWTVGDDSRIFTQQVFTLRFDFPVGDVLVRLIATLPKSDSACRKLDPEKDTVFKILHILSSSESPMYGKYYGCIDGNSNDSIFVVIKDISNGGGAILNISKGCTDTSITAQINRFFRVGYEQAYMNMVTNVDALFSECFDPEAYAILSNDHKYLTVQYTQSAAKTLEDDPAIIKKRVSHVFKGARR